MRQRQYRVDDIVNRHVCTIYSNSVRRWSERSNLTATVTLIPVLNASQKGRQINTKTLMFQLLMTPFSPRLRTRGQENLNWRIREHHGPHVSAIRHQPRLAPETELQIL